MSPLATGTETTKGRTEARPSSRPKVRGGAGGSNYIVLAPGVPLSVTVNGMCIPATAWPGT